MFIYYKLIYVSQVLKKKKVLYQSSAPTRGTGKGVCEYYQMSSSTYGKVLQQIWHLFCSTAGRKIIEPVMVDINVSSSDEDSEDE